MRKPDFDPDGLRRFLEEVLGGSFAGIKLITACSRPENFVVWRTDGEKFSVKCVPPPQPGRLDLFPGLVAHLKKLARTDAVQMASDVLDFEGRRVLVTRWCEGKRLMPHQLDRQSCASFIRQYGEFSQAMQRCSGVLPPRDNLKVIDSLSGRLQGLCCSRLRRFLERETQRSDFVYDPARLKVIHGDLHHGNFHFNNGAITGFMDLEDFRLGYPADDLARYVICGAEHQLWFDLAATRRTLSFFRELLPLYPRDEWREAVLGLLVRKFDRRLGRKGLKPIVAANLTFRLGLYRRMLAMVDCYSKQ